MQSSSIKLKIIPQNVEPINERPLAHSEEPIPLDSTESSITNAISSEIFEEMQQKDKEARERIERSLQEGQKNGSSSENQIEPSKVSKDLSPIEIKIDPPNQELEEGNSSTTMQLKLLFETRYGQEHWPKTHPKAILDCEGFSHYLMKGKIGKFEESEIPIINKVDLEKKHSPYTCYKIWQPTAPWAREKQGYWTPVHYFTHLENGQYTSKNGIGPIRFFDSFEEMLKKDAFPFAFVTKDCKNTKDIKQAAIGESIVDTIS